MFSKEKIIVSIETSTIACSAAVLIQSENGVSRVYEVWEKAPRQHTDLILPMLDDVLQQSGCQLDDADALAFGCGPGAFTGVRIATSVIQAISYASKTKVISVSSLAALAQGYCRQEPVETPVPLNMVVASDARMGEVYLACYQSIDGEMLLFGKEALVKPEIIANEIQTFCTQNPSWVALGNGWDEYQDIINTTLDDFLYQNQLTSILPHAQDIAFLALNKLKNNQYGDAQTALPVYLRNDVAKKTVDQKIASK